MSSSGGDTGLLSQVHTAQTDHVDYSQSLEQMIAAGHYDYKTDGITRKNFPVGGEGTQQFEVKVFYFDCCVSSKQAVEAMKADGWEPARIEHLLAFGAKYPEEQNKQPIIALGFFAKINGSSFLPYIDGGESNGLWRRLDLFYWRSDWLGDSCVLAVRKLPLGPQA